MPSCRHVCDTHVTRVTLNLLLSCAIDHNAEYIAGFISDKVGNNNNVPAYTLCT